MSVQTLELEEMNAEQGAGEKILDGNYEIVKDVQVKLEVIVGDIEMSVEELFALQRDSVVPINKLVSEPLSIMLNGKLVAQGNLVAADDNFGIRITQINQ